MLEAINTSALWIGYFTMGFFILAGLLELLGRVLRLLGLWKMVMKGVWNAIKEKSE